MHLPVSHLSTEARSSDDIERELATLRTRVALLEAERSAAQIDSAVPPAIDTGGLLRLIEQLPAATAYCDGTRVHINPALEQLTGYSAAELSTLDEWFERLHPGAQDAAGQRYEADLAAGFRESSLIVLTRKDGAQRTVEFAGAVAEDFAVWVLHDVTDREAAAARLAAGEQRMRQQFDAVPVPTYVWERRGDHFVLTDFNTAAVAVTDAKIGDYLGTACEAFFDGLPHVRAALHRSCESGETIRLETRWRMRTTQVEGDLVLTFAPAGPEVVLIHTEDVSERRAAERALGASEQRFRSLIENANDPISVIDADGTTLYASPAYERVTGYRPDELEGRNNFGLVHPDDLATVRARLESIASAPGRLANAEYRIRHKNGAWRTLHSTGTNLLHDPAVRGIVLNSRDITDRVAVQEAARRADAVFRALTEQSLTGMYLAQDGRLLYANPRCLDMFGYTAADAASIATPFDVLVPEERTRAAEMMRRRLDGTADGVFRTVGLRKDGQRIDIEIYGARIDLGGNPAIVGTLIDISDRLRAEAALRESEAQLRQAQKMEAVGQLAGGIAHDFNNLLTALMGHLELARCELERDHPAQPDLEGVLQAADRAATLTRQLLTVARRDTADPRPLDLNVSVRESTRLFARLLGERVSVELALAPAVWATRADPGQIDQVLLNLVVNARDAMPKGGVVTVETANERIAAGAAQGASPAVPAGEYVRLTVRDTGVGMAPATRARVFEPFFTTKGVGRGTGLGLAVVYGIVTGAGGWITVDTVEGEGSAFHVYLPRTAGERGESAQIAGTQPGSGRGETVLLVEDEAAVRTTARRTLERNGYHVLEARHGADALLVWSRARQSIDVVVTDVRMPEMDGPELVAALRADRPDLPVLFTSGYLTGPVAAEIAAGEEACLAKPFSSSELVQRVRRLLDRAVHSPSR